MAQSPMPIAIIGMACRLPGTATNPENLWKVVSEGQNTWSDVPEDRFAWKSFHHPHPEANGAHNHRGGHFLLEDVAGFDAQFFGISPLESQAMDPQQRFQLELAYEAIENAGITLNQLRGSDTSVHVAMFSRDYDRNIYRDPIDIPRYHLTGSGEAIMSNRLSYILDLKGPSMTLDTGCSGSLVALHLACQGLRSGDARMAIVGGTNLILNPDFMITMSMLRMLNDDGRSYSFDSRGEGYGRGEGVAAILLKPLSQAMLDGDPIRAVIRNTAVNSDGKTAGITLPSQAAQESLERTAFQNLEIDPTTIDYIEAHGTGTVAGDLAELNAIANIYNDNGKRKKNLFVGSVKSNIGHLESASGVAGLIKTVLAIEKNSIPPMADVRSWKRDLRLEAWKINIPLAITPWPEVEVRRASVNSFGYGGTNAHAILESAPVEKTVVRRSKDTRALKNGRTDPGASDRVVVNGVNGDASTSTQDEENNLHLLVVSAKSIASLVGNVENLKRWMLSAGQNKSELADLAYTLAMRRSIMQYRLTFIASSYDDFIQALSVQLKPTKATIDVNITFLFTGQGAQWHAMGRELIYSQSKFQTSIFKSDKILRQLGTPWSLIDELMADETTTRINQSDIAQPASTALQIALVDLLEDMGIKPHSVLGHSSGEIAAAYAAGALTQRSALQASFQRSFISMWCKQVIQAKGSMLAVGLGEEDVSHHIDHVSLGTVSVACVNSPSSTTISGDDTGIDELKQILDTHGIFARKLKVDTAYHSHHMQQLAGHYLSALDGFEAGEPEASVKFMSSVTGEQKNCGFNAPYWVQNMVSQVRYCAALQKLCRMHQAASLSMMTKPTHILVEIGSHNALAGPTRQCIQDLKPESLRYTNFATLLRGRDAKRTMMELCGKLFECGCDVDLEKVHTLGTLESTGSRKVLSSLPPYAWDHSVKYWHESRLSKEYRLRPHPLHDILGVRVAGSTTIEPSWRNIIRVDRLPWLSEHVIDNFAIFPGAAYVSMAAEAIRQITIDRSPGATISKYIIRTVSFSKALIIPDAPGQVEVQLSLKKSEHDLGIEDFHVVSLSQDGKWTENCHGTIAVELDQAQEDDPRSVSQIQNILSMGKECKQELSQEALYKELRTNGNVYGPMFATMKSLRLGSCQSVGDINVPNIADQMPGNFMQPHVIHPATLDAIMHSGLPLFSRHCAPGPVMPVSIKEITLSPAISHTPGQKLRVGTSLLAHSPRFGTMNTSVLQESESGSYQIALTMLDVELQGIGDISSANADDKTDRDMGFKMEWRPDVDFLTMDSFKPQEVGEASLTPEEKLDTLNGAAMAYIQRCIQQIENEGVSVPKDHHKTLFAWMRRYCQLEAASSFSKQFNGTYTKEHAAERLSKLGVEGQMLARVGENLFSIVSGKIEPLGLMLEDDLLYTLYADESSTQCYSHAAEFVKNLSFKNPNISILEIGAGTGGATRSILEAVTRDGNVLMKQYDFTDISSGFFERARMTLADWNQFIQYKTLNIESSPLDQGFTEQSYDLIVASNVLHATKSIQNTLTNARSLLKPGGRLMLIEVTRMPVYINVIFGTLPGWWAGVEDGRRDSPLLSMHQWDAALTKSAIPGIHLAANDFIGAAQRSTMMVSRPMVMIKSTPSLGPLRLVSYPGSKNSIFELTRELYVQLAKKNPNFAFITWSNVKLESDTTYVIMDDGNKPLLADLNDDQFERISKLATGGARILWLSAQGGPTATTNPQKGLVTGLARTARAENETTKFITLDVQQDCARPSQDLVQTIVQIVEGISSVDLGTKQVREFEYIYRNDALLIPRVVSYDPLNNWIGASTSRPKPVASVFHDDSQTWMLDSKQNGKLDDVSFIPNTAISEPLLPNDLEIKVQAIGIDEADLAKYLGQRNAPASMSGECAGIITAVGSNIRDHFQVGDRVCALNATPFASRARVSGQFVYSIPTSLSLVESASLPIAFVTAYQTLIELAKLEAGQKILILGGETPAAQAAIRLAQLTGSEIFVSVSNEDAQELIVHNFALPRTNVFLSTQIASRLAYLEIARRGHADIIFDANVGENYGQPSDCLTNFGKYIRLKRSDNSRNTSVRLNPQMMNAAFFSFDFSSFNERQPVAVGRAFQKAMSLLDSAFLKPIPLIRTIKLSDIEVAFRLVQGHKFLGKVVLDADSAEVKVIVKDRARIQLDSNASYLIAGGLGDLGKRIAKLMITRGATHVVLLTRRVVEEATKAAVRASLVSVNANARVDIVTCDVTNESQVQDFVNSHTERGLPPLKGVVQASMVLKDRILEHMTLPDFHAALLPKFQGTHNLDKALKDSKLDFFIMFSSCASILGNRAQANYSAGNAFQDYLANSQFSSSTNYVALNLGIIEDAGVLANNRERGQSLLRQGYLPVRGDELLFLVEYAMGGMINADNCQQAILGFSARSIANSESVVISSNPMFSHLTSAQRAGTREEHSRVEQNELSLIKAAQSIEEARGIIVGALSRKLSALVSVQIEDINVESSMADFGLDSLIAIELKNWMNRDLNVPIQTTEIMDSTSIMALGSLAAQRSDFNSDSSGNTATGEEGQDTPATNRAPQQTRTNGVAKRGGKSSTKWPTDALAELRAIKQEQATNGETALPDEKSLLSWESLPTLPLPDLESTLQSYLLSVRAYGTDEELEQTSLAIKEFTRAGSIGLTLHDRLLQRSQDSAIDNWVAELYNASNFLDRRVPINPFNIFFGSHFPGKNAQNQAKRAAVISYAAYSFKKMLEAGQVEQEIQNEQLLCMHHLQYLFNTTREPHHGSDKTQTYPGNDYILVLRRGHIFKLGFMDGDKEISYPEIEMSFNTIVNESEDYVMPVCTLTADERNTWAQKRQHLQSLSLNNNKLIQIIEAAAFVVCLEDAAPETPVERATQFLTGDVMNRWSDKSLQFVICSNGASAYVAEHTMVDGTTIKKLNDFVTMSISEHENAAVMDSHATNGNSHPSLLEEFKFDTDKTIAVDIERVKAAFQSNIAPVEVAPYTSSTFGAGFFRAHKIPPKTGWQLVIQLASRLHFGYLPACWEPISMRPFHKGRVEISQIVLPSVAAYVTAMLDASMSREKRQHTVIEAAKAHTRLITLTRRGKGVDRHLSALYQVLREDEPLPKLFSDPLYGRTRPRKIMTDSSDSGCAEAGFVLRDSENVWCHYEVGEDDCRFAIVGTKGNTASFIRSLEQAAVLFRQVFDDEASNKI